MESALTMTHRELTRFKTISRLLERRMPCPGAAQQLNLSERKREDGWFLPVLSLRMTRSVDLL